jgi:ABC-type branched-subunit amino acid transport system substrate-binding protein
MSTRAILVGITVLALAAAACSDAPDENTQTGGVVGLTDAGGPKVTAGDCAGFKNGVGVTDDKITIANASDLSGLVPGLFKDAQQAVQAYVEYFNAGQDICGRKLEYLPLDSRLDAAGDQQAAQQACGKAFAMIGSMSAFDSGGAPVVSGCGIPDLRVASVTPARLKSDVTYATNSLAVNLVPSVVPDYFLEKHPDAMTKAAFLYLNAGSGLANGKSQIAAYEKRGIKFIYTQAIDPLDVNYTPYILAMKNRGVRFVQFIGDYNSAARLAKVMAAQQFKPDVYLLDAAGYDYKFVRLAGPAAEGTRLFINSALFEEAESNEEMRRYMGWLQKVAPNSYPTYFGLFAWSSARLFTEQAIQLGGKLDRASLLAAISKVNDWDGHGLFSPMAIGKRQTGGCTAIIRLEKGEWVRESEGKYICGSLIDSGYAAAT